MSHTVRFTSQKSRVGSASSILASHLSGVKQGTIDSRVFYEKGCHTKLFHEKGCHTNLFHEKGCQAGLQRRMTKYMLGTWHY